MEEKRTPKLFTWRHGVIVGFAAACGIGLNAYRTYKTQGKLDALWIVIALITMAFAALIFFLLARHANKPEKED
jgi:hypothetical protein